MTAVITNFAKTYVSATEKQMKDHLGFPADLVNGLDALNKWVQQRLRILDERQRIGF